MRNTDPPLAARISKKQPGATIADVRVYVTEEVAAIHLIVETEPEVVYVAAAGLRVTPGRFTVTVSPGDKSVLKQRETSIAVAAPVSIRSEKVKEKSHFLK